jgi:hypothetical protein
MALLPSQVFSYCIFHVFHIISSFWLTKYYVSTGRGSPQGSRELTRRGRSINGLLLTLVLENVVLRIIRTGCFGI